LEFELLSVAAAASAAAAAAAEVSFEEEIKQLLKELQVFSNSRSLLTV
jgi:hypothetical protein